MTPALPDQDHVKVIATPKSFLRASRKEGYFNGRAVYPVCIKISIILLSMSGVSRWRARAFTFDDVCGCDPDVTTLLKVFLWESFVKEWSMVVKRVHMLTAASAAKKKKRCARTSVPTCVKHTSALFLEAAWKLAKSVKIKREKQSNILLTFGK